MPAAWTFRKIATGVRALRAPTDGRRFYLPNELGEALGVDAGTIRRWVKRGYIRPDPTLDFLAIPVAEALRFSREGPPPVLIDLTRPRGAGGRFIPSPPP